jgi:hypothetical protein
MGKTIYCISNGSPEMFPDNTLTSFGNKFPFMYDYGKESNNFKLQVAVDSIGFSLNFNPNFISRNKKTYPHIIIEQKTITKKFSKCYSYKYNELTECDDFITDAIDDILDEKNGDEIYTYKYIHFDNSILDMRAICEIFKKFDKWLTIYCNNETNTIRIRYNNSKLLIHFNVNLFPFVKISTEHRYPPSTNDLQDHLHVLNTIEEEKYQAKQIGKNYYQFYRCEPKYDIILELSKMLALNCPKIIKVKCKNIRDQIYNNTHEKDLLVFSPQIDEMKKEHPYFFHEFETRTYCTLENTILDQISFELHNEFNEPLHLDTGIPTLLKLDIIAMEKYKKAFNIRIASTIDNRSNFTVKLPQNLRFNDKWRVCLSSINLPNSFNTFLIEKNLTITFRYEKGTLGVSTGPNTYHPDQKLELVLKNKKYTKKELLSLINLFLNKNSENIDIGEIVEYTPPGRNVKMVKLIQKHYGNLEIPEPLVQLLGDVDREYHYTENGIVYFIHVHEKAEKSYEQPLTSEFLNPINASCFRPSYIMLYTDIIQPIAVSGVYMNIMKIFPTSPSDAPYVIKEFKNTEYLSLNNYDIKEISFQLRNHAGDFISFDNDNRDPVILNLHFSNY